MQANMEDSNETETESKDCKQIKQKQNIWLIFLVKKKLQQSHFPTAKEFSYGYTLHYHTISNWHLGISEIKVSTIITSLQGGSTFASKLYKYKHNNTFSHL